MGGAERVCACCWMAIIAFFGFWTLFSIVGAIHYATWYSRFDLQDLHIRAFNVTPDSLLTYDMDVLIQARHFSAIRRIEHHSYEVHTSHVGLRIGSSGVPTFHPGASPTKTILSTQRTTLLPMGEPLGALVRRDLNETGRVAIRLYIQGEIYTSLFLAQRNRKGLTCDLIVSPGRAVGEQIYEKKCCKDLRCMEWCSVGSSSTCCRTAVNCCLLPPSSLRSTISICG